MPPLGFACKRCGHCCNGLDDSFRNAVDREDVAAWVAAGRWDILRRVHIVLQEDEPGRDRVAEYRVWVDPATGDYHERSCPWFGRDAGGSRCAIYALRPRYCRDFPVSRTHAEGVGCPGFWA